jgi:hypothetical protein
MIYRKSHKRAGVNIQEGVSCSYASVIDSDVIFEFWNADGSLVHVYLFFNNNLYYYIANI